jgi:S1-C subfamily serine protease
MSGDLCSDFSTSEIVLLKNRPRVTELAKIRYDPPNKKSIAAIAKAANGAIVSIIMSDKAGHPIAQGSGFLISHDGHVVTNYHVIKNGAVALAKLPDGTFFAVDGMLVGDKNRDVAIIKIRGADFRTVNLGDSDRLQVGEDIVAIGNPLSLESTVSNGIVSAIRTAEFEAGFAAGDHVKHARRRDRAYDLRDHVRKQIRNRKALADHETDADGRVQVAAGDVSDGERHGEYGEAEGQCAAGESDS